MADKRKNIVFRFGIVYSVICLSFLLVLYKIVIIQTVERRQWMAVAAKSTKKNIIVKPNRGNIYACDGRLMASSIPSYYVYMDLRVPALHEKNGKLFKENIDSVSIYLSSFFGEKTAYEYKTEITKAYHKGVAEYKLFPKRISYSKLKTLRTLPLFKMGSIKSGLITKESFSRVRPFTTLAKRTIGDIYSDESKGGKNGIELYFNKILLGKPGLSIRQKVANRYMETVQVEPVDGMDITSTIDVDLQDIAEKALVDSLRSYDAGSGYAILMETQSGEVKAIVNMQQNADKSYSENQNGSVSDQVEPGSTFKVMSLMAAIDDGKVKITDRIETGNGIFSFGKGAIMKDWNANKGGFHTLTLAEAIHVSSNIGISRAIVNAYGNNPSAFVDKLYKMKLNEKMNIEIPGTAAPRIRHPHDKVKYWSKSTLPWMSIGYEVQIPPIYTLAYFNAIANNGKFIRPFFVKSISKNGQIIKTFNAEVINEAICKQSTLRDIREALLGVVEGEKGTAKNVHSKYFGIAGKTGTAQISKGALGYKSGGTTHQVSFCGYFPADNPQYTCIVVIRQPRIGYPSGGKMAGSVFKSIAESTMALKSISKALVYQKDSLHNYPFQPYIKTGFFKSLQTVTTELKLPQTSASTDWVKAFSDDTNIRLETIAVARNVVPDLTGMGAKDAVFLTEKMGLNVQVQGRGKLISQSINAGYAAAKGSSIILKFE